MGLGLDIVLYLQEGAPKQNTDGQALQASLLEALGVGVGLDELESRSLQWLCRVGASLGLCCKPGS